MRKYLLLALLGVVLSGCGGGSSGSSGQQSSAAPSPVIDASMGALAERVGNPDVLQTSAMLSREAALAAAVDYGPRTGRWFEGEDGFTLITSISAGEQRAGSEASVGLGKVPEGRSVRFQITSRDREGKRVELLKEYVADNSKAVNGRIDFSFPMPERPNVNYLLSIEIVSPANAVEDTLISPLFVPPHELNVRLEAESTTADSDKTKLKLYNAGPLNLYFGYGYSIYRQTPEGWRLIPIDGAYPAIGIQLQPGQTFEEEVWFRRKLEPGQYRLVKHFGGYMTDLETRLAADFEIR